MEQKVHQLKCVQPFFDAVKSRDKNFEVRKDDRNFRVGDRLDLFEGDNDIDDLSYIDTDHVKVWVTYKLTGGQYGIEPGYCVLGLTFTEPED